MKNGLVLVVFLLLLSAFAVSAEGLTLGRTNSVPTVDGVVGEGEYALTADSGTIKLSLSWVGDTLSVAVSGQTAGWVAVGFGSSKMNDALMYLGAADDGGGQLTVQKGKGHGHADLAGSAPTKYLVKESGGQTVLELTLPASAVIDGQDTLNVIYAMGSAKAFTTMHKSRFAAAVALQK